jgi:hypothetical protein
VLPVTALAAFLAHVTFVAADDLGVLLVTCHFVSSKRNGSKPFPILSRASVPEAMANLK